MRKKLPELASAVMQIRKQLEGASLEAQLKLLIQLTEAYEAWLRAKKEVS